MTRAHYIRKFREIYGNIPEEKRGKAEELIGRLADLLENMDECKKHLKDEGCVTEMDQGKYSIMRENPYSKVYDAKHKLMLATMDKLDKMQPSSEPGADALMEFLQADDAD